MSLLDGQYALISPVGRSIAGIVPDCTIEEKHSDRVALTEHPVMQGAAVSDHSYSFPPDLSMRVGFSNSSKATEGWVQQAYSIFLALKDARQPFGVSTGKRAYQNMIVTALDTTTDETTEWCLMLNVTMRYVNIVSTQTTSTPGIASSPGDQAMPQSTASLPDQGDVQAQTASGLPTFAGSQATISGDPNAFQSIEPNGGFSFTGTGTGVNDGGQGGFDSGSGSGVGDGDTPEKEGAPITLPDVIITRPK